MKKFLLLSFSIITLAFNSYGQNLSAKYVFALVDIPAEPPGGYPGFYQFISEELLYPQEASKLSIEGKVYVQFVIDETGDLVDDSVRIVQGLHPVLDREAVRVVKLSSNWSSPQMNNGEKVKQRIILPISFKTPKPTKLKRSSVKLDSFKTANYLVQVERPLNWKSNRRDARKINSDIYYFRKEEKNEEFRNFISVAAIERSKKLMTPDDVLNKFRKKLLKSNPDILFAIDMVEGDEDKLILTAENIADYFLYRFLCVQYKDAFLIYGLGARTDVNLSDLKQEVESIIKGTRLTRLLPVILR